MSIVRATVLQELDCMPSRCQQSCSIRFYLMPSDMFVVRHPWQWEVLVPSPYAHILGTNAWNRLWHSDVSLWEAWELSKTQMHDCLFPVLNDIPDKVHLQPPMDHAKVLADAFQCVQLYNRLGAAKGPHLSVEVYIYICIYIYIYISSNLHLSPQL